MGRPLSADAETTPTLSASRARIDYDGVPQSEGLDVCAQSEHVGLGGDWRPLFDLLEQKATLGSGTLELGGVSVTRALAHGIVGLARCDVPLPKRWQVLDYVAASARLTGYGKRDASRAARDTLERLELGKIGKQRLDRLTVVERRALGVAHASVTEPPLLVLETPLGGLDDAAADYVRALVGRAARGRRMLVSVSASPPSAAERALLSTMGEVWLMSRGAIVANGRADDVFTPGRRYAVTATKNGAELARSLGERGLCVRAAELASAPGGPDGALRFFVVLPDGTAPVLDAAVQLDAPIVELVPLPFDDRESGLERAKRMTTAGVAHERRVDAVAEQ